MGINAFAQGLRSVNPDASISVIWVNTWYDPVKETSAAKVHIAEGADVLAQHTDSPAMLQVAEKEGAYGFGQSTDMISFAPKAQCLPRSTTGGRITSSVSKPCVTVPGQQVKVLITGGATPGVV